MWSTKSAFLCNLPFSISIFFKTSFLEEEHNQNSLKIQSVIIWMTERWSKSNMHVTCLKDDKTADTRVFVRWGYLDLLVWPFWICQTHLHLQTCDINSFFYPYWISGELLYFRYTSLFLVRLSANAYDWVWQMLNGQTSKSGHKDPDAGSAMQALPCCLSRGAIFNALLGDTPYFGQIWAYRHMRKKYGQVRYSLEEHQKCSSETLTSGP